MDAVVILSIALVFYILIEFDIVKPAQSYESAQSVSEQFEAEDTTRTAKLNESFYEDPNAFTEISTILGFPMR